MAHDCRGQFFLNHFGVKSSGWITSPDIQWAVPEAPVLAISAVNSEPTCEEKITVNLAEAIQPEVLSRISLESSLGQGETF